MESVGRRSGLVVLGVVVLVVAVLVVVEVAGFSVLGALEAIRNTGAEDVN